jgi:hypothetical protein
MTDTAVLEAEARLFCIDCSRALRKHDESIADHPGTKVTRGRGQCENCAKRSRREIIRQRIAGPASPFTPEQQNVIRMVERRCTDQEQPIVLAMLDLA